MVRIIVGIGLLVFGLFWIGVYVDAVIEVLGQPDRSMVFWALPILFAGLGAVGAAAALLVSALRGR